MVEQQRTDDAVSESTSRSRLLAGKYEVIGEISRGAFGKILKVRQIGLDKVFAAKILAADAAQQDAFKRLAREGQILTKLSHPNIVKVYSAAIDEEVGFVVLMDYLDGKPLSHLIKDKKLTVRSTVDIAGQMCSGLQYAHENGILHRDLKPSNVMIVTANEHQQAILIDFGIAKVQDATQKLTQTGAVLGTPLYMSPEQLMGQQLDARSDVYSFGCVLYEMLTGQPPFPGDNWMELAAQHHSLPVVPPSEHNREIPFDLERIVLTCMAKKPEQRYQSIAGIVQALNSIDFNVRVSQSSMLTKRLQAAKRLARPAAVVFGVGLSVSGAAWLAINHMNLSNAEHLLYYSNQEAEIAKLIDDSVPTNDRQTHEAQKRSEQLIRTIVADSPEARELPTLHMLLAKSYRLQGRYRDAIDHLATAQAFKDKVDLPAFLPVELGMAYFGNDQFSDAIGVLDTDINRITDPAARVAAWQWRSKAFFFKPEMRAKDKNRRYSDANGQAVNAMIGLKFHRQDVAMPEARQLLECSVISALVLNRQGNYVEFVARGRNAWGSRETLELAGQMIGKLTPKQVAPLWMALYEQGQAELAAGLQQPDMKMHRDKVNIYLSRIPPPANQFEKHETRLWVDYIRERQKELGWI